MTLPSTGRGAQPPQRARRIAPAPIFPASPAPPAARPAPADAPAEPSAAAGQRPPAADAERPKRRDQFRCPHCGKFGCPAEGGSRYVTAGVYRYRRCRNPECHMRVFKTFQPHGGEERLST
jgi:hypothetical protein